MKYSYSALSRFNIVLIIYLIFSFGGCDLFKTRDAESPTAPRSDYEFPSTAQAVLNNFKTALKSKDIQNYMNCFSDSNFISYPYRFIPSNGSASIYPGLAGVWSVRSEQQFISNLFLQVSATQNISLDLTGEIITPYPDSTLYSANYTLSVPLKKSETTAVYSGGILLTLRRDSRSVWAIGLWQDIKNSNQLCWSDLKGIYY